MLQRQIKMINSTYVAESSLKCECEEVEGSQIEDWEQTCEFAQLTKSDQERLPNQDVIPADETEMNDHLHGT